MRKVNLFILITFFIQAGYTQNAFTGGPLTGAVTDTSARIYVRTASPMDMQMEYGTDSSFSNYDSLMISTISTNFSSAHIFLNGLQAGSRYYYRIRDKAAGTLLTGIFKFRTFPVKGAASNVRLIVGSCGYNNLPGGGQSNPDFKNDLMFQAMADFDPHMFIHLGDWNYPPSPLGSAHLANPALAAQSFDIRYNDPNMKQYILPNMAVDYIYDDDYSQNGTAGWTYPRISAGQLPNGMTKYVLEDKLHPAGLRDSAIHAYYKHFPAYPQSDTSGIHHKITIGNIDIFMTDTRSSKSPVHAPFKYNALLNTYTFEPDAGHTTLGETQRQWLLDELSNSTAGWKIIGTSVLFNRKMRSLMDAVLLGQLIDRSLIEFASSVAYMWSGYPEDLNAVLDLVANDSIENVIVISGDTHSSMMDDGANAGLPELSSSGLSADDEGYLNYTIDSLFQQFGVGLSVKNDLWNGGGSGIENANFSDTYATMEFFGKDSVQMCIIDEFLQTLSCMTLYNTNAGDTTASSVISTPESVFQLLYPNPARSTLQARFSKSGEAVCKIVDMNGRKVLPAYRIKQAQTVLNMDISSLPDGAYLFVYESDKNTVSRKFIKK